MLSLGQTSLTQHAPGERLGLPPQARQHLGERCLPGPQGGGACSQAGQESAPRLGRGPSSGGALTPSQ